MLVKRKKVDGPNNKNYKLYRSHKRIFHESFGHTIRESVEFCLLIFQYLERL